MAETAGNERRTQSSSSKQRRDSERDVLVANRIKHPPSVRINVTGAFINDESDCVETRDIHLPNHTSEVSHIAVDIGGSLAKIVYFSRDQKGGGGRLNFVRFETEHVDECIEFIASLVVASRSNMTVMATGGGAFKYYDKFKQQLGVEIVREDEMECLIVGLDFFITEIPGEVFTHTIEYPMNFVESRQDIYPYLLVNIGSGVSMIKVEGPNQFVRIGGSSVGGGTLWGLLSLLTEAQSFDDMLVGDIYGTDYGRIGLKSTTIASSFGKVFKNRHTVSANGETSYLSHLRKEDMSKSLLYAVSNNIGQIAYLQAQKHNLEHIYFGGSFIRGHTSTMNTLSYAIRFWSNNTKVAYFLRHEGYLGAVGAFLRRQPPNWGRRYSSGAEDGVPGRAYFQASSREA